jgi:NTP pyrophosphatase (non-canonical NTP hydrolase)
MDTNTASKSLAQMQAEVVEYNHAMGWRENDVTFGEAMALLHTEVAEASDAWRRWGTDDATQDTLYTAGLGTRIPNPKPEGVGSEFADVFIRLLDDCDLYDVDLERAAGRVAPFVLRDSFLENMNDLHTLIAMASHAGEGNTAFGSVEDVFGAVLALLRQLCEHYGIDLMAEYERKMAYNRTRPYKHGGKRQ